MKKSLKQVRRLQRHANLSKLRQVMPPFLSRKHPKFKEWTGYSPRSFANMDSLGETSTIIKIMQAGAVAYESESLVDWMEERSFVISE